MIKKALLVAGVVFALYTLFIHRVKPHWSISQHKGWQDNQIKAEKYLYDSRPEQTVVVGSSLAAHLNEMPGVYNLSFSGQSALDGLTIVTRRRQRLRTVLIEMNFIDRDENFDFIATLTNPVLLPAKRRLLSLRNDKQPLAVVGEQLQIVLDHLSYRFTTPGPGPVPRSKQVSYFQRMLVKQRQRYAQPPEAAPLERQLSKLRQAVAVLEQRGVRVVFYEMPVDYRLCDAPRAKAIRGAFYRYFPPATYSYIYPPTCADYSTTDGLHLDELSGIKYTAFLQQQVAELKR